MQQRGWLRKRVGSPVSSIKAERGGLGGAGDEEDEIAVNFDDFITGQHDGGEAAGVRGRVGPEELVPEAFMKPAEGAGPGFDAGDFSGDRGRQRWERGGLW
jgi:hypothetical protein